MSLCQPLGAGALKAPPRRPPPSRQSCAAASGSSSPLRKAPRAANHPLALKVVEGHEVVALEVPNDPLNSRSALEQHSDLFADLLGIAPIHDLQSRVVCIQAAVTQIHKGRCRLGQIVLRQVGVWSQRSATNSSDSFKACLGSAAYCTCSPKSYR